MKEMLLFGAGASQEADVPTAFELTEKIAEEFRKSLYPKRHSQVVSFVLGGLLFKRGIEGENPLSSGVNVEEFFNAIQLLADRNALEAAPFVGSWHSMVEEFDKLQPSTRHIGRVQEIIFKSVTEKIISSFPTSLPAFGTNDIDKKLSEVIKKTVEAALKKQSFSSSSFNSVGKEVGDLVLETLKKWIQPLRSARPSSSEFEREFKLAIDQQGQPGEGRIFREVADEMIEMLVRLVFVEEPARVAHLKPLKDVLSVQPRLTIATLNYDNCVELFCGNAGIPCDTGIDEWSEKGSFEEEKDGVFLLKLHGSIDWQSGSGRSEERPMPHRVIKRATAMQAKESSYRPAVIFGSRNKLTAEGPFLDLLRAFQRELKRAERLTIVGYSFGDAHINVYISQWLNSGSKNRLRIINGEKFGRDPNGYARDLLEFARERVEIIPKKAGPGLLDAYSQKELPLVTGTEVEQ
jgi:hypothetical protein